MRLALFSVLLASSVALADDQPNEVGVHEPQAEYGIGARFRYVFMPTAVLNLFLDHSTPMASWGIGADFIRRKGNLDIDFAIEWENISPKNGLYESQGDDPGTPGQYPDFVEFQNFALLGADASFIWHVNLFSHVQFRYGAGIGVGAVLGKIVQHKTICPAGTTDSQLENPNICTETGQTKFAAVPPVVPIVNVQLGFRIRIVDKLSLNLEGGFRDVFFAGAGIDYFF
jgi:hypothetical protein